MEKEDITKEELIEEGEISDIEEEENDDQNNSADFGKEEEAEEEVNTKVTKDSNIRNEEEQVNERDANKISFAWKSKAKKFFVLDKQVEIDELASAFYVNRNFDYDDLKNILTKKLAKTQASRGIVGIKNLVNTCYINTILQSLIQNVDLLYYVLKKDYESDINNKSTHKGQLAINLFKIIETAWLENNTLPLNIQNFRTVTQALGLQFASSTQQDPHEFFLALLDGLQSDLSKQVFKGFYNSTEKYPDESDLSASKRFWNDFKLTNTSVLTDIYYGQIKHTLICPECVSEKVTFEHFSTLSLAIPKLTKVEVIYVPSSNSLLEIKFPIWVSESAMFFDIDKYVFPYLKVKPKKIRSLLSYKQTQRIIKSSENIVSLSGKGNIVLIEIPDQYGNEEENDEYYPLLVSFRGTKTDEIEYITYSRILPIDPYQTIIDLRISIFALLLKHLIKNEKIKEFIEAALKNEKIENLLKKANNDQLFKIYKSFINSDLHLPYSIYLTNETFVLEKNKAVKRIYIYSNKDKENNRILETMKDNQTCEELINMLRNTMKFHIEFDPIQNEKIIKSLNTIIVVEDENQDEKSPSLFDCLTHFQLTEKLDKANEYYCQGCYKNQSMFKKATLFYMPKNLVITFKRFITEQLAVLKGKSKEFKKDNTLVKFPVDVFNIDSFIPSKFELYSVCQHSGSMTGGHYFTTVKNLGKWHGIDDTSIFPSDIDSIVIPEAYMLFFRRK
jgi:ubiquitin C-terminal hydrolase